LIKEFIDSIVFELIRVFSHRQIIRQDLAFPIFRNILQNEPSMPLQMGYPKKQHDGQTLSFLEAIESILENQLQDLEEKKSLEEN